MGRHPLPGQHRDVDPGRGRQPDQRRGPAQAELGRHLLHNVSVAHRRRPVIAVEGLTKIYGNRTALDHVSFEVPEREIFGFVGPNGAGKTTTLRILAALLEPTEGKAYIGGADVMKEREKVHTRIGYMPDFFGVYDQLTVSEYLDFYASCYQQPKPRRRVVVDNLLELVDLGDRRDQGVDTLSRGLKQRVCLARALVHDPAVLLLDEPAPLPAGQRRGPGGGQRRDRGGLRRGGDHGGHHPPRAHRRRRPRLLLHAPRRRPRGRLHAGDGGGTGMSRLLLIFWNPIVAKE